MNIPLHALSCLIQNQSKRVIIYKEVGNKKIKINRQIKISASDIIAKYNSCKPVEHHKVVNYLSSKIRFIFFSVNYYVVSKSKTTHDTYVFTYNGDNFLVLLPPDFNSFLESYGLANGFCRLKTRTGTHHAKSVDMVGMFVYMFIYYNHGFNKKNKQLFRKNLMAMNLYLK
jgi:uncharacterized protein YqhQ